MQLTKRTINIRRRRYANYEWQLITDKVLSLDELVELQSKQGYPANAYGFYSARKYERRYKSGKVEYKYNWECSCSSD